MVCFYVFELFRRMFGFDHTRKPGACHSFLTLLKQQVVQRLKYLNAELGRAAYVRMNDADAEVLEKVVLRFIMVSCTRVCARRRVKLLTTFGVRGEGVRQYVPRFLRLKPHGLPESLI
jgi:hypothetical protein